MINSQLMANCSHLAIYHLIYNTCLYHLYIPEGSWERLGKGWDLANMFLRVWHAL